jgi:hypothetical protein
MGAQVTYLARARNILNETSAGFWSDAQLYTYFDSAQMLYIDLCLAKENAINKIDPLWRHPDLFPLVTIIQATITSGTAEYDIDGANTDYGLKSIGASAKYNAPSTDSKCTRKDYNTIQWKATNTYEVATVTNPFYYIRNNAGSLKIGFVPTPDATVSTTGWTHIYYKKPTAVDGSGDFLLQQECHEALLEFALYFAYQQDDNAEVAQLHFKNGLSLIL